MLNNNKQIKIQKILTKIDRVENNLNKILEIVKIDSVIKLGDGGLS